MPRYSIQVNAVGADVGAGAKWSSAEWSSLIDHGALVSAKRSRADGYDFRLQYEGVNIPFNAFALTSSGCYLEFNNPVGISAPGFIRLDLIAGDLGAQTSPFSTITGIAPTGSATVVPTISAMSLPRPGFPLDRTMPHAVVEDAFPESPVVLRRAQNENAGKEWRVQWRNLLPDEWYTIRAFADAVRGTAGSFSLPSWLQPSGLGRFVESPVMRQNSRRNFEASAVIQEVFA